MGKEQLEYPHEEREFSEMYFYIKILSQLKMKRDEREKTFFFVFSAKLCLKCLLLPRAKEDLNIPSF